MAVVNTSRYLDLVTEARDLSKQVYDGVERLEVLNQEITDNGGIAQYPELATINGGNHSHAHLLNADVSAVTATSQAALKITLAAGHGTNLAKLF